MANYKVNRMTEDIRRELTDIMHMMKDPRISSLLTIMKVDLSNDYGHCRVYISSMEGIEKACEQMKAAGAKRALPLKVGGAFHSPLMNPAKVELETAINTTEFHTPKCPFYQNVDARPHPDP